MSHTLSRFALVCSALVSGATQAHFVEMIPSQPIVQDASQANLDLAIRFTHPMEQGPVMAMAAPEKLTLWHEGKTTDLTDQLQRPAGAPNSWQLNHAIQAPGDHTFIIQPVPYWEPAEGKMIVHYTKLVVDAYSGEGDWFETHDLPVEIQPLSRPYGLWTGNQFRGVVLKDGKPEPFAEVEVEWRNDGSVKAPADAFVTQVVLADANGTFSYTMPRAGWWGFAALVEADKTTVNPEGKQVPVELGGLIWVNTQDMK